MRESKSVGERERQREIERETQSVCVCVCVRERKRKREGVRGKLCWFTFFFSLPQLFTFFLLFFF